MKKILAALALAAFLGLAFAPVQAERVFDAKTVTVLDPTPGYAAIVCSVWNNDSDPDGGYTSMDPGTGNTFHLVQVYANALSAAQTFTIRFWETTTDSTSIGGGALIMDGITGDGGLIASFPIQCKWLTFTGVANTDDITVIGYLKDTAGPVTVAD